MVCFRCTHAVVSNRKCVYIRPRLSLHYLHRYSIFGSSRQGAVGPQSVPCLFIGATLDSYGIDGSADRIVHAMALTMIAGICMIVIGVLRLGVILNLISRPVLNGFVSAAGLVTSFAVIKDLLGTKVKKSTLIYEIVPRIFESVPDTRLNTLIVSVVTISLLLGFKKLQGWAKTTKAEGAPQQRVVTDSSYELGAAGEEGGGEGEEKDSGRGGIEMADIGGEAGEDNTTLQVVVGGDDGGGDGDDGDDDSRFGGKIVKFNSTLQKDGKAGCKLGSARCLVGLFFFVPPLLVTLFISLLSGASICRFQKEDLHHDSNYSSVVSAVGQGATLPVAFYQNTTAAFACASAGLGVDDATTWAIDYDGTGSGAGQNALLDNAADFVGTDVPFAAQALQDRNGGDIRLYPTVAAAVCAVANVQLTDKDSNTASSPAGLQYDIVLSREVLAGIFRGNVTRWNDVRIQASNPNIVSLLPDAAITVLVRQDSSGTTSTFTEAMSKFSAAFKGAIGTGKVVPWPSTFGSFLGTRNLVDAVVRLPNSISYAAVSDVLHAPTMGLTGAVPVRCVSLEGPGGGGVGGGGNPVRPGVAQVARAVEIARSNAPPSAGHLSLITDAVLNDPNAWPICTFTYIAVRGNTTRVANDTSLGDSTATASSSSPPSAVALTGSCARKRAVASFLAWLWTSPESRSTAQQLSFVPLPVDMTAALLARATDEIRCPDGTPAMPVPLRGPEGSSYFNRSNSSMYNGSSSSCGAAYSGKSKYAMCADVTMIGHVPGNLVPPVVPNPIKTGWGALIVDGIFLAFLVLVEHLSNALLYASKNGYEVDGDRELIAVGMANVVGSFFGSFAVGAGFSRSVVNAEAGARSPMALGMSGVLVLVLMLAVAPVLYFVPKPVLSVVILMSVLKLVDVKGAVRLWRTSKHDLFAMATAFFASLFFGIIIGVATAVGTSLLLFVVFMIRPRIVELGRIAGTVNYMRVEDVTSEDDMEQVDVVKIRCAKIIRFEAPIFFANVKLLRDRLDFEFQKRRTTVSRRQWEVLILDFSSVDWVDVTACDQLLEVIDRLQRNNTERVGLCFANVRANVKERMGRCGFEKAVPFKYVSV